MIVNHGFSRMRGADACEEIGVGAKHQFATSRALAKAIRVVRGSYLFPKHLGFPFERVINADCKCRSFSFGNERIVSHPACKCKETA